MRRVIAILVVLVVAMSALIGVRLYMQRRALSGPSGGSGEIEGTAVDLSSRVAARILKLSVRKGQPVSRTNTVGRPARVASPCSEKKISVRRSANYFFFRRSRAVSAACEFGNLAMTVSSERLAAAALPISCWQLAIASQESAAFGLSA